MRRGLLRRLQRGRGGLLEEAGHVLFLAEARLQDVGALRLPESVRDRDGGFLRRVENEERFDYVVFKFGVSFARPERFEVSGEQLANMRPRLDKLGVRYEALEKKNDFGIVVHAKLMVTGPFPCEIVLRGDYDHPGFVVEMQNVGRIGASRFRIGADELTDDILDELGHWLLGAGDAFARLLERGQAK